jgi:hypothetical protein
VRPLLRSTVRVQHRPRRDVDKRTLVCSVLEQRLKVFPTIEDRNATNGGRNGRDGGFSWRGEKLVSGFDDRWRKRERERTTTLAEKDSLVVRRLDLAAVEDADTVFIEDSCG